MTEAKNYYQFPWSYTKLASGDNGEPHLLTKPSLTR